MRGATRSDLRYTEAGLIPVAARSKECVCGRSLAEIAGLNPAGGLEICLLSVLSIVRLRYESG